MTAAFEFGFQPDPDEIQGAIMIDNAFAEAEYVAIVVQTAHARRVFVGDKRGADARDAYHRALAVDPAYRRTQDALARLERVLALSRASADPERTVIPAAAEPAPADPSMAPTPAVAPPAVPAGPNGGAAPETSVPSPSAIGTAAGVMEYALAVTLTVVVFFAHVVLRPLSGWIERTAPPEDDRPH